MEAIGWAGAEAAATGFDPAGAARAEEIVRVGAEEGHYTAAAYVIVKYGEIALTGAVGEAQPHREAPSPVTLETVFDMASLTKPITAALLLQCVERGDLHLRMPLDAFIPEAAGTPLAGLTVLQLATHTSGLPAWKPLYKSERGSALAEILCTELEAEPGARYCYSDLGYILLGTVIERLCKAPLDRLARERIFQPLGMDRTGFCPADGSGDLIAATANCPWREGRILVGEVHDANAHSMGGVSGHAGVFSTASDMTRFAMALFHARFAMRAGLPRLLNYPTALLARTRQTDPAVGGHSVGWFTEPNTMLPRGDLLSEQTVGHTGFTGTMVLHDPTRSITILLLTNRVYNPADGTAIGRIRRRFANAVAGAFSGRILVQRERPAPPPEPHS